MPRDKSGSIMYGGRNFHAPSMQDDYNSYTWIDLDKSRGVNNLAMSASEPAEDGEDRACDFLHVGSGWFKREPLSFSQAINLLKCDEKLQLTSTSASLAPPIVPSIQGCKFACRNSHGRESNRVTPYSTRSMIECSKESSQKQDGPNYMSVAHKGCDAKKSAAEASKQSDFDNLSLGPGCPWLDVTDFHI